jgi:RNA polymerase sigma factor (sigma-70 family)
LPQATDLELMTCVREGDLAQLGPLFERYHVRLFNYFRRLGGGRQESEDLVQEVFLRILKYRTTFRGEGSFAAWIYRLARNAFRDHLARGPAGSVGDAGLERQPSTEPAATDVLVARDSFARLRGALGRLSNDKREALVLSRFEGLPYAEIADVQGCSVGAVKVRIHRALRELRELCGGPEGGSHEV